jgi:inhibitor of cysteine peptidase
MNEMVHQEVKKKTRIYGTIAVLSAIVLATLVFALGSTPGLTPNGPGTGVVNASPMPTFNTLDDLKAHLIYNQATSPTSILSPLDSQFSAKRAEGATTFGFPTAAPSEADSGTNAGSYSSTNIQVAGVDEADLVKTDGTYIYTASNNYSNGQNQVFIVKADPSDPRVIARISLGNDTFLAGMFLSQDSSKLVIIGSQYQVYAMGVAEPSGVRPEIYPYYSPVKTFLHVYDISEKSSPVLARNYTLSGSYFNSRMIGQYVYAIVSQSAFVYDNVVPLPKVYTATSTTEIPATTIFYADKADYTYIENKYFTFTSFYGLNLNDLSHELTNMTVLMGGASNMYVSLGNIYVTYPTWSDGTFTSIYRVSINGGSLTFQAKGSVSGNVLNQYSMDEFNGYFRLATTNWKDTTENSIYVLNMNLTTVGTLELKNAEIRETIMSVRFIGNKAYIVTFEQKDPFFVLDMSNPTAPRVSGKLEIPGYSSYLHPYNENYIIGLGIENSTVKLSLFDVTNVNAPREIAKYIVQGDYTYSQALYEPKAFLFDIAKQLLVIPVSITKYGVYTDRGGTIPPSAITQDGSTPSLSEQGGYWDGAYVFKLTAEGGFELRGGITHQDVSTQQYWYGDYTKTINRALYIDNTLYTVSNAKIKLNSLTDLAQIAEVKLS